MAHGSGEEPRSGGGVGIVSIMGRQGLGSIFVETCCRLEVRCDGVLVQTYAVELQKSSLAGVCEGSWKNYGCCYESKGVCLISDASPRQSPKQRDTSVGLARASPSHPTTGSSEKWVRRDAVRTGMYTYYYGFA